MDYASFITNLGIGLAILAIAITLSPPKNEKTRRVWSLVLVLLSISFIITTFQLFLDLPIIILVVIIPLTLYFTYKIDLAIHDK